MTDRVRATSLALALWGIGTTTLAAQADQPRAETPADAPAVPPAGPPAASAQDAATPQPTALPAPRLIATPDGSRFLLVASPQSPVIHWVIASPAGDLVDPTEYPGISHAVARASLSGTDTIGTRNWTEESKTVRLIERLETTALDYRATGDQPTEKLLSDLDRARKKLASLRDESAWMNELAAAPAIDIELVESPEAVLFRLTTTPEGFSTVAYMLMDRRENARLRTLDQSYRDVARERSIGAATDGARLRQEVRDLGYFGLGSRTLDPDKRVDPDVAFAVYQRTQNPLATFHVIVGGFDLDALQALLMRQFTVTTLPPEGAPTPQPRRNSRERSSTIEGRRGAIAFAFAPPPDISPLQLGILADWIGGGDESYMARALRSRGFLGVEATATTPFPISARPGLVLIELWLDAGKLSPASGDFADAARAAIKELVDDVRWKHIERSRRRTAMSGDLARSDPATLAAWLAIECGIRGRDPVDALQPPPPTVDFNTYAALAPRFLQESNVIVVELEKAR